MSRKTLTWVRVVLGVIAAGTLLAPRPSSASDVVAQAETFGGYNGSAAASGLHAFYNPEGALPTAAPVDLGAPDALATLANGPTTFARAGVVDPGDLLANPDALLSLGISGYKPGTVPAYPYRAIANSGSGPPTVQSNPAPGLDATASADQRGSNATARMPATVTPTIATLGSMSAVATTTIEDAAVSTHAVSTIKNLNILGLITIDSIATDLKATSKGGPVDLSGGTVISRTSVMGMPVTIDADGIHQAPGSTGIKLPGLAGNLNSLLTNAGIRITLAGPVQQAGGKAGQLGSNGLRIDMEFSEQKFPALKTLLDAAAPLSQISVPGAPGPADIIGLARARHLVAIEVGRGTVSLDTRPAFVVPDTPVDTGPAAAVGAAGAAAGDVPPSGFESVPGSPATSGSAPANAVASMAPVRQSSPSAASLGAGIGALALLALLVVPFVGERLARVSQAVLADEAVTSCPREGA